ncbi:MAG TPA: hypothetical protein VN893_19535, partial [Bryobacteraceae bacterium]|nr:hypothetical protein [Bryobacteraceae bacterium]
MTGASLRFLAFSALVILLANLSRRFAWRQTVLLAANAAFLWECAAGESLLPLIAFVGYGYGGLKLLEARRARAIAPILVGSLLIYIWLKEYAFLPSALLLRSPYSTIGLSYILFRIIHLLVDARSGALGGRVGLVSYLTYTLNFTTLVAGPIQRYQDFDKGTRTAGRPSIIHIGEGLERIIVGCFKANVLGLAFAILKTDAARQVAGAASWGDRVLAGAALVASCPLLR